MRNASLSGVSEYFPFRSFFSSSRPTSASIIARKPRTDAPVCLLTCSTVFGAAFQHIKNFVRDCCADDQRRRVGKTKFLQTFGSDLFFRATSLRHIYFGYLEL